MMRDSGPSVDICSTKLSFWGYEGKEHAETGRRIQDPMVVPKYIAQTAASPLTLKADPRETSTFCTASYTD
jgi:hypothetical protein